MAVVSHYNVAPVIDIFGAVTGRDLGSVASDIDKIIDSVQKQLPRGSQGIVRGQVQHHAGSQRLASEWTGIFHCSLWRIAGSWSIFNLGWILSL